jgi:hypothetical protein
MPLAEQPTLRFAVGTFDAWPQLREGLRDAQDRGLILDSFSCIALERVFTGQTLAAPSPERVTVQALPFPNSAELIACTSGPLAECLIERLNSGARTLREALGYWLVPRHAAHFEDTVQAGNILLWIRIADADEERRAYQSLLASSSNSVGVHDLVRPRLL